MKRILFLFLIFCMWIFIAPVTLHAVDNDVGYLYELSADDGVTVEIAAPDMPQIYLEQGEVLPEPGELFVTATIEAEESIYQLVPPISGSTSNDSYFILDNIYSLTEITELLPGFQPVISNCNGGCGH